MGIEYEIPWADIFPLASGPSQAVLQSQSFAEKLLNASGDLEFEGFKNYASFEVQIEDAAHAEVRRLAELGYIELWIQCGTHGKRCPVDGQMPHQRRSPLYR
eukprot:5139032-Amphidinium_carterae.5